MPQEEGILTPESARALSYGQIVYDRNLRNSDGTPWRWRVNGRVKTWKRDPARFQIPIKRGLWDYGYIDKYNVSEFALDEETAQDSARGILDYDRARALLPGQIVYDRSFQSEDGTPWRWTVVESARKFTFNPGGFRVRVERENGEFTHIDHYNHDEFALDQETARRMARQYSP